MSGIFGKCCAWIRLRACSDSVSPVEATGCVAPAAVTKAPAKGAMPSMPSTFLLDTTFMARLSSGVLPSATSSRHVDVVFLASWHEVPKSHHGVVLMNHVVTVDGVLAQPVAEAEEQLHAFVGMHLGHVLTPQVPRHGGPHPVATQNLMLLEVDVNRVRPITGEVGQQPLLRAVLPDGEAEGVAVHELAVNRPLAVQAIELERADNARLRCGARQLVEGRVAGRFDAF